ncbi:Cytochrome P450 3A13, partial [Lachnellula suecica]
MLSLLTLLVIGSLVLFAAKNYWKLQKNIANAKKTGLPYLIVPFHSSNPVEFLLLESIIRALCKFEYTSKWRWVMLLDRELSWRHIRVFEEQYGDTFLTVSPVQITLKTSNAELITQMGARRNDFVKRVDRYKIVNLFGTSILTTEGQEWKQHKKITGPSFSEKSNRLVFEESLRQAQGMIDYWSSQGNNSKKEIKVEKTAEDTATLSFHVICAAGFGVPQLWPGESEEKLQGNGVPGFSYMLPGGRHMMTLKDSLINLLHSIYWFGLFTPWMLKNSPFKKMNRIYSYYFECLNYFNELLELRKKELYLGENDKGTMDLMVSMIKASEESPLESKESEQDTAHMSKDNIIGNSFIFLFAGHETSGNSIHYSILLLAMSLHDQRRMQADIDQIVGKKPSTEWSYQGDMPRLYNSMVGAVLNEQLRLIPAISNVPKWVSGDQAVRIDGRDFVLPDGTQLHWNVPGTNRNPRYWPKVPSKISGKDHDMDDFVPSRWLPDTKHPIVQNPEHVNAPVDGLETASFETASPTSLVHPPKGAFITFSEARAPAPGRRFAQVEITTVLAAVFQKYSVELDVQRWASDEEVALMGVEER